MVTVLVRARNIRFARLRRRVSWRRWLTIGFPILDRRRAMLVLCSRSPTFLSVLSVSELTVPMVGYTSMMRWIV